MSRRVTPIIASLAIAAAASGAGAQGFTAASTAEAHALWHARADSTRALERPVFGLLARRFVPAHERLRLSFVATPGTGASPAREALATGIVRVLRPTTPLERVLYGADKGAFTSLAVGTLGSWAGLWEEETAWYMMGAGAAIGAVLGGTLGSEHVHVNVGVRSDAR